MVTRAALFEVDEINGVVTSFAYAIKEIKNQISFVGHIDVGKCNVPLICFVLFGFFFVLHPCSFPVLYLFRGGRSKWSWSIYFE